MREHPYFNEPILTVIHSNIKCHLKIICFFFWHFIVNDDVIYGRY